MFRRTVAVLAPAKQIRVRASGYGLFLRRTKNHPQLRGLDFTKRCKTVLAMWNQLSQQERDALNRSAKTNGILIDARKPRGESKYHKFVKKNMNQFNGFKPKMRLKLVAQQWQLQKDNLKGSVKEELPEETI